MRAHGRDARWSRPAPRLDRPRLRAGASSARSQLTRLRVDTVCGLAALPVVPAALRTRLLRLAGHDVHPGARLFCGTRMAGAGVSIGRGTFVNTDCILESGVRIGERCDVGPGTRVLSGAHGPGGRERRAGAYVKRPAVVGDGCWIGAGVVVLPGVRVGDGCVVGAGSVVARDCEPHGLYVGAPARRVRDLP